MRSEEFLKRFRVLEDMLETKYAGVPKKGSSIVMEYLSAPESLPCRTELDLCREVRNILTHNAEIQGEPVVEPSPALLDMLDDIIAYVKEPPLALHFATPSDRLLSADLGQRALEVMRAMERRGFSHVPVLQKGEVVGVFSVSVVFSHVVKYAEEKGITPQTRVRDFMPWLPVDKHVSECYGFIDRLATLADVKHAFERIKKRDKRLAALFITQTGRQDEPLLGMVTPWDVLGQR